MIRVGLTAKVASEQRPEGVEEIGHGDICAKKIKGIRNNTLDSRGKHAGNVQRVARRPVCLQQNEKGGNHRR